MGKKLFHRLWKSLWKDFIQTVSSEKKHDGIKKKFDFPRIVENPAKKVGKGEPVLWINRRKSLEKEIFSALTRKKGRQRIIHSDIPATFYMNFFPQTAKIPCGNGEKAAFQPVESHIFGR
jgi:hypothetical protein